MAAARKPPRYRCRLGCILLKRAAISLRTGRAACVALLLVVVPLLPACQLFLPVGTVLGERLLYTPSIGFCLLLGWACDSCAPSPRPAVGWRLAVAGLLGCGYAALTVQRNGVWYDDATLFRDAALACPDSAKVQATLGTTAVKAGQVGEAESHFSRAIEIFPEYDDGLYSLGRLYFDEAQARPNMRLTLAEKAEKLLMCASHHRRPSRSCRAAAPFSAGVFLAAACDCCDRSHRGALQRA